MGEETILFSKREKCQIAIHDLKFLGYILNKDGISLDMDNIQALINSHIPTSCTDVRGLLGGLQMLRRLEPKKN